MIKKIFIKWKIFFPFIFLIVLATSCQKEDIYSDYEYKTLGTSAHDFLSAERFTSLMVQLDYMPGFEPSDSSIGALENFLNLYLNKPAGITITKKAIVGTGHSTLFISEVAIVERRNRTLYTAGNVLTAHILITDGYYDIGDILATSYWNTSFVIFGRTVDDYSGRAGQVSRTKLVSALLCHEMGHLLGLVNQGTSMVVDHQDRDNGAHCNNMNCLMNYAVETMNTLTMPTSGSVPLLDNNCHSDLIANGGK